MENLVLRSELFSLGNNTVRRGQKERLALYQAFTNLDIDLMERHLDIPNKILAEIVEVGESFYVEVTAIWETDNG